MMRSTFFDRHDQQIPASTFKVVVLGHAGVSKTSLINRFCREIFSNSYSPSIGYPCLSNTINIGQQPVNLKLWEINPDNNHHYGNAQRFAIANASAFIVLFELSSMASFQAATELVNMLQQEFQTHKEPGNIFLAGTKLDLTRNREVSDQHAQSYADHAGCTYIALSSKNNTNVNELFQQVAKMQLAKKPADYSNDWILINDETSQVEKLFKLLSDPAWLKPEGWMSKVKDALKRIITVLNSEYHESEDDYFKAIKKIASTCSTEKEKSTFPFFASTQTETPLEAAIRAISTVNSLSEAVDSLQEIKNQHRHTITQPTSSQLMIGN